MSLEFFERVAGWLRKGRPLVVATILETVGSTPRKEGARMAILDDGSIEGTVGGGAFEALVIEDAKELLSTGGSMLKEYRFQEGEEPESTGMVCGGRARVHLQVERPPERLLVFGAGHVGSALGRLAARLGFSVTLLDDRKEMLAGIEASTGIQLQITGPEFSGELPTIDASTYIAIVTRCHRTDLAALKRVVPSPAAYVGMIGSRRKVRVVLSRLGQAGVAADSLRNFHSPIGLSIGACTPEEIAVSIAAEMIQTRRGFGTQTTDLVASPVPVERHRRTKG